MLIVAERDRFEGPDQTEKEVSAEAEQNVPVVYGSQCGHQQVMSWTQKILARNLLHPKFCSLYCKLACFPMLLFL